MKDCVRLVPALVIALSALLPPSAVSSEGFSWNRKALDLSTSPSATGPPGTWDIVVTWSFEFGGEGTLDDLSTDANVSWGLGPRAGSPECIIWDIKDSCALACATAVDSCGTSTIDGIPTTLHCDPPDGLCHGPILTGAVPAVSLSPGDEITVVLLASEGAAAEMDTSDDSLTIVFGPTPSAATSWGRVKNLYR